MIEIVEGLPETVIGIVAKGRITKADCAEVLLPAIDRALEWHHRLRLYYEIRSRYPGAGWEEIALGGDRAPLWERVAIVTDVALVRHTLQAVRLLIPSDMRVFTTLQIPEGVAWITEPARRPRVAAAQTMPAARAAGVRQFQPAAQYLRQAV